MKAKATDTHNIEANDDYITPKYFSACTLIQTGYTLVGYTLS